MNAKGHAQSARSTPIAMGRLPPCHARLPGLLQLDEREGTSSIRTVHPECDGEVAAVPRTIAGIEKKKKGEVA